METYHQHSDICRLLERIPVLTYHKIDTRKEVGINCLSPARLQEHIDYLATEGYRGITFHELHTLKEAPEKAVIITFDDGYESVYTHAYPILRQANFKGVVFVVAGFIDRWNDWDINLGGIRFRHLTREQIRELENNGWEVGAHGMTHRALSHLPEAEMEKELLGSREVLTALSKKPVQTVAYPFGIHNERVHRITRKAGFVFGCSSVRNLNSHIRLMQIPRIPVYQFDGVAALRRKIALPNIPFYEWSKLYLLSLPAFITPFYQRLFRRDLFLDIY